MKFGATRVDPVTSIVTGLDAALDSLATELSASDLELLKSLAVRGSEGSQREWENRMLTQKGDAGVNNAATQMLWSLAIGIKHAAAIQ